MREALVQLVGEGIAVRLPNRGFAVPDFSDRRWQQIAEKAHDLDVPGRLITPRQHQPCSGTWW
ncbi:hypothetical protein AB0C33_45130 [Nonomuraea sp. NPDC048881]|uniref:hypothetical protein n=1 Tax=Nonomuraea sp. NPDC048881 TaxID=3155030 RepID=UPI0033FD0E72